MGYFLNKMVSGLCNPMMIGVILMMIGVGALLLHRKRGGVAMVAISLLWGYFWASDIGYWCVSMPLESRYPVQEAEALPEADAIVILGGGISAAPGITPYPDLQDSADRVWFAARLYLAGKARLVIPTGTGEENGSVPFLKSLGVPAGAILVESRARNTEENALLVKKLIAEKGEGKTGRVLLVTSSWHMRRSVLNFEHAGLEVIPAATDYPATIKFSRPFNPMWLWPDSDSLWRSSAMFKEYLGYWLYRIKYGFTSDPKGV